MKRLAENGLTHREIAALLGMSHANVQVIERRAIAKASRLLERPEKHRLWLAIRRLRRGQAFRPVQAPAVEVETVLKVNTRERLVVSAHLCGPHDRYGPNEDAPRQRFGLKLMLLDRVERFGNVGELSRRVDVDALADGRTPRANFDGFHAAKDQLRPRLPNAESEARC